MAKPGNKTYSFRNFPQEVFKIVLKEQLKLKLAKGMHVSVESTIYSIIREWERCKEFEK